MKDEGFMLDWTHYLIRVPGNSFVAEGKRFTKLFCDTYMAPQYEDAYMAKFSGLSKDWQVAIK